MQLKVPADLKALYPFESNFHEIETEKMHYIDQGSGEKTYIMIHGNPTWSFYYRNLIKDLSKNARVIAIDHLNCGLSSRSEKFYRYNDRIEHIINLIESLELNNLCIIGHDWGGAISVGVATRLPNKTKSLVLMNTACFPSDNIPKRIAMCRLPVLGTFLNQVSNGFLLSSLVMGTSLGLGSLVKKGYLYPYKKSDGRKAIDDFVKDIPMETDHPSYAVMKEVGDKSQELEIPVLLLWGEDDFCFDMQFYHQMKSHFKNVESYSFKNVGHYVLEDAYDGCFKKISEFIQ